MSLVTTARFSSPASAWHSAATRAVLPEPTGPPMPIRSARALVGQRWVRVDARVGMRVRRLVWWVGVGVRGCPLFRMQRDVPPRWRELRRRCPAAVRSPRAARRRRPRRGPRPCRRTVAVAASRASSPCTGYGSRPSSRTAALAGAAHAAVRRDERRVLRRQPGAGRDRSERDRAGADSRSASVWTAHMARPARSSARPCARDARRSAGDGVRASRFASRSSRSRPATARWEAAAAKAALTSPAGGQPAPQEGLQRRQIGHPAGRDRRLEAAGVGVPAGRQSPVGEQQQRRGRRHHRHRHRRQNRK